MRKRVSAPVNATDASAQIEVSRALIRATTLAENVRQIGTATPTATCPAPGPLPGGFGIDPLAQMPRTGEMIRQKGASQTRFPTPLVPFVPTLPGSSAPGYPT